MKLFTDLLEQVLNEAQKKHSLNNILSFEVETGVILPIHSKQMKRIFGTKRITAFHVTDRIGLKKLIKIQGQKKSISTFTKLAGSDFDRVFEGIETEGGIIIELEGNVIIKTNTDIYSFMDSSGYRWISLKELLQDEDISPKFITDYMKMLLKIMKFIGIKDVFNFTVKEFNDFSKNPSYLNEFLRGWGYWFTTLDSKQRNQLYKKFFDYVEQLYGQHTAYLRRIFRQKLTKEGVSILGYNEVVVNEIEIKKLHIFSDNPKKTLGPIINKFNYEINNNNLEDQIKFKKYVNRRK